MSILETKDLRKVYGTGDTAVRALDGVDLTIEHGEFVAMWGPPAPESPPCCICWAAWTGPPPAAFL